jgi:hypothetical protein
MDHKKSPKGKKRQSKQFEDTLWECSACTYRNNPEAFKCSMCGIRKGTSTRKPKLNPDMLEVQVQKHAFTPPAVSHHRMPRESEPSSSRSEGRPGSSASNDPGNSEDEEEVSPSSTTATTTTTSSTPTTTSTSSAPKSKKLKLPPVPKGKSKVGGSLTNGSNGISSSVPTYSTPIIGRGGRIRNIDRKSGCNFDIVVDDVTITITEYKLKPPSLKKEKKGGVGGSGDGGSASQSTNHSDGESDSQDTRTT